MSDSQTTKPIASEKRTVINLFWWLHRVLFLWVKAKTVPEKLIEELKLSSEKPTCYLLNTGSFADLLVLEHTCRTFNLPRPRYKPRALNRDRRGGYFYLRKVGLFAISRKGRQETPEPLIKLVKEVLEERKLEIQFVPVSIFWGRNPGKEKSIFKLLFFDDEHAGIMQRLFIVLAQGRSCFVQWGKPISLRQLADEGMDLSQTAKKLRRVLRIHFRRQRNFALGPSLNRRVNVVDHLLRVSAVKNAITEESVQKKISEKRARLRARRYLLEVAADVHHTAVRLFDIILGWIWNKIFNGVTVKNADRIRSVSQGSEVVYLPCHRSHLDYLLLSYSLYNQGVIVPHTAAGVNLNFWPVGPLVRRAGAFFIRRSFKGNKLYAKMFTEYVHYLVTRGHSIKFYCEGGRSRTGKLLTPKTGLLAIIVQSFLKDPSRDIEFLPVYLGYDKVVEIRAYQRELRGSSKRPESVGQFLKARRVLKKNFGKAYISFAKPISLRDFFNKNRPGFGNEEMGDLEHKPDWLNPLMHKLATSVLEQINKSVVVSPQSICALILLATPQKAVAHEDVVYLIEKFLSAMRLVPYSHDIVLPDGTPKEVLAECLALGDIQRFEHPGGDVLFLDERSSITMTYYRNNILHLVAIPALVASFLQHNDKITIDSIVEGSVKLYPFLKKELFLYWPEQEAEAVFRKVIDELINLELLTKQGDFVGRPQLASREFTALKVLSRALGQTLERYAVTTAMLCHFIGQSAVRREEVESQCQLMAQRISILTGTNDPEFFDKALFRNFIDLLRANDYIEYAGEGSVDGELKISESVLTLAKGSTHLLSFDIRESIARSTALTHDPAAPAETK